MSPEEILTTARTAVESLNLATVYRNLNALFEAHQLVRVEVYGQSPRYEMSGLAHHHHFLCERCNRLFDVPGCPELPASLAPPGFTITGHDLTLFGYCTNCTGTR